MVGPVQQDDTSGVSPQFETADYAPAAGACAFCHGPLGSPYYHVNGQLACDACATKARAIASADTHARFVRALLFGAGGAAIGLALYATVAIVTGLMIGYVSVAVGYIVAKAMMKGSGGAGGRRYQIAAVLLTYAAVSMAAIPIAIASSVSAHRATSAQAERAPDQPAPVDQAPPTTRFVGAVATLAFIGLASPFLELQSPMSGLIGLVILFVGLQIAWKATAGRALSVEGPF